MFVRAMWRSARTEEGDCILWVDVCFLADILAHAPGWARFGWRGGMDFPRILVTAASVVGALARHVPSRATRRVGVKRRRLWWLSLVGLAALAVCFFLVRSHRAAPVIWHGWPASNGSSVVLASQGPPWTDPQERRERVFVVSVGRGVWAPRLGTVRATYWSQDVQCLHAIRAVRSTKDGEKNVLCQLAVPSRKVVDLAEIVEVPEAFAVDAPGETMVAMYRIPQKEFRLVAVRLGEPSHHQLICVADHYLFWQLMSGSGNVYFTTRRPTPSSDSAGLWRVGTRLANAKPELVLQDVKGVPFAVDPLERYAAAPVRGGPFPGLRLFALDGTSNPVILTRALTSELKPELCWSSDGTSVASLK